MSETPHSPFSPFILTSLFLLVCKDGSCYGTSACTSAKIDYVADSCNVISGSTPCYRAEMDSAYKSCIGDLACRKAQIGSAYKSCTRASSCYDARFSDAYESCTDIRSCSDTILSGLDLINSCNNVEACQNTKFPPFGVTELIDCCNGAQVGAVGQCEDKQRDDIVTYGCVSYVYCFFIFM